MPINVQHGVTLCIVSCFIKKCFLLFYYAPPFSMGGEGGGGEHIVSPLSVRPSVRSGVRNTFGFHAISSERIGILD